MNILLYDFLNSYILHDLIYFLQKQGHNCNCIMYRQEVDKYDDDPFTAKMDTELDSGTYDFVLTINFWPVVSKVCNRHGIRYVSWFFDSPPNLPTAECMEYTCNKIYFFSRADYEDYRSLGLDNVFYLPLAVNVERLDSIRTDYCKYEGEISFVGRLYQSMLPSFRTHMNDYQNGYLDAVVNAQMKIYGAYLVDELITEDFSESVRKRYRSLSETAMQISRKELAWAVISYITHLERMSLLRLLSSRHQVKLYTFELTESEKNMLTNVDFCGPVSYLEEMPQVFRASKVNLCPIIKANKSGIPLRALDVMGAGGFLLSSYQPELYEYFLNEQECVMYTSIEDCIEKADFYLRNDNIRKSIALAGKERIKRDFRYEDRIAVLLENI